MEKDYCKRDYLTPEVTIINISVEAGFAASIEDPIESDPMEW